jgi:hypothetical protein
MEIAFGLCILLAVPLLGPRVVKFADAEDRASPRPIR